MRRFLISMLAASSLALFAAGSARAQQPANAQQPAPPIAAPADDTAALAKKLSNPISDLVSIPFQFNWRQKVGPLELSQFILNIQPVIPYSLTKDWNVIGRLPV